MRSLRILKQAASGTREAVKQNTPTEAQRHAGNYLKLPMTVQGLKISIENPRGSWRRGVSPNGDAWQNKLHADYGYIKSTMARDGDAIDVFVSPKARSAKWVHIIDQVYNGKFDEHKCMIGWDTQDEARKAYLKNYEKGWDGLGAITTVTMDEFKKWIHSKDTKKPYSRCSC